VTFEELQRLNAIVQGARHKTDTQLEINEAKLEKRRKAAQAARNLEGTGALRHVPRGSIDRLEQLWKALFAEYYPEVVVGRWFIMQGDRLQGGKEVGLCSRLILKYSEQIVTQYFRYAVANWFVLHARFPKWPLFPTIGWLSVVSDSLLPESQSGVAKVELPQAYRDLEAWMQAHPGEKPPEELLKLVPSSFLTDSG